MPVSLGKIEKMLLDNKFVITSFYILEEKCEYVKTFSINSGETLIIHIPREYDFIINEQEMINKGNDVFHLTKVNLDDNEEVDNESQIKERYTQIEEKTEYDESRDLAQELEKNYKTTILLKDLEKKQILEIKDCQRQLKRLQHIVQNLKYNICLVEENNFLVKDRFFIIKTQKTEGKRFLFLVIDIESFHENSKTLIEDILTIKNNIYKILDKNSEINSSNLFLILEKFENIEEVLENIVKIKNELHANINEHRELLENIIEEEKEVLEQISLLEEKKSDYFSDSQYVHKKSKLENKILSLQNIKQKLLKNLNISFQKCDNTYLKTDKCEFDIAVFLDDIYKNLKILKEELS